MNKLRQVVLGLWILCLVGALAQYFIHPEHFTPAHIAAFLQRHDEWFLVIFLFFSVARAFVLLPVTPLIIAGALLMPNRPWALLGISLLGIALASALIYYFSDWLGFRQQFEHAAPRQVERIEQWLRHPLGGIVVAVWSFLPFVPTDLVCYVAGMVRMPFGRFLTAVLCGETILCSIYIFSGGWLSRTLLG